MNPISTDSPIRSNLGKILRFLDGLKKTQSGSAIYKHIERTLEDCDSTTFEIEQTYATLLGKLLDAYAKQVPDGSPLQVQIKLVKLRLEPPVTINELKIVGEYLDVYISRISQQEFNSDIINHAFSSVIDEFEPAEATKGEEDELTQPTSNNHEAKVTEEAVPDETESIEKPETNEQDSAPDFNQIPSDPRVDTAYRRYLQEKRGRIQKVQDSLARQVTQSIKSNEEFGVLLEVELSALEKTTHISDVEKVRSIIIKEIRNLLDGHRSLTENLDNTFKYLQIIESDSQQLNEELTRVHLLSLTDELTDLPNRRAFVRRLEDEVARVQRYGYPLTLALIDIDEFKIINDKHGHSAGDEVLKSFSSQILSVFRHHDMVARYGGEEFAILLPNTSVEGATRALEKVRSRASECTYSHNNHTDKIPTFSSGVALYKPGETSGSLIERADQALYRAKRLGRNRTEVDVIEKRSAD